jgi:hypothetical protein
MFVGIGIMWVGPRRSDGRSRAKRYCGAGWMFRRPKLGVSRTSIATEDRSSDDDPPRYIDASTNDGPPRYVDASTQSSLENFLKIAARIDPHDFDLGELVKRFRDERSRIRSHERRPGLHRWGFLRKAAGLRTRNKDDQFPQWT